GPTVAVMIVRSCIHREQFVADAKCRLAPCFDFMSTGKCETHFPQMLQWIAALCRHFRMSRSRPVPADTLFPRGRLPELLSAAPLVDCHYSRGDSPASLLAIQGRLRHSRPTTRYR